MRRLQWFALVGCLLIVPTLAHAQASIGGVVRDTSGAVLPGVTVEASSPALIEKVRLVTTDSTGVYQIVDLRPGAYTVTFMLPGFRVVKREGIELSGSFAATVNADMSVGAVEETVTVTGESPTVDVQSTKRSNVISTEVVEALPDVAQSIRDGGAAARNDRRRLTTLAARSPCRSRRFRSMAAVPATSA